MSGYFSLDEQKAQTEALNYIVGELEQLNSHILAYLKVMAVTLLAPCGPEETEAGKKARGGAALELLQHVEKARETE